MELELIYGTVAAVVFQNPENGYSVLRLKTQDQENVTVVGTIPMVAVGERLSITGKWGTHSSYGRQFEAEILERLMPESADEILSYLSSRIIKGIGEKTAARIVTAFGDRSLDVIENDPVALSQVQGLSLSKAKEISESFRRQVGMRRLLEFLAQYHLPSNLAMRLYRAYGELAADALKDDPYMLTEPYFGASFSVVDAFALSLDVEADDERRVEAGILFELIYNQSNGHTFIPKNKLTEATALLLGLEHEIIEAGISRLSETERLLTDHIAGLEACYIPELFEAETYISDRLRLMASQKTAAPKGLERLLREVQDEVQVEYAQQQLEAVRAAASQKVLIVTGGPGTGKTTAMAGILRLFEYMGLRTQLTAPTGRAAKRLSECTGRPASTIHRLLEAQFDQETGSIGFYHDEEAPLRVDAVVVDETSMVDILLMQSLLKALPADCRLILVGDPDQLPSVGPGNLFSDLIRSEEIQTVRLTEVFRQARESLIVMNAHEINKGGLPEIGAKDRDFFFMKRNSAEAVVQTIRDLCFKRLPDNMGIDPSEIQVLSPTRKGETGTKNLNKVLQSVLNPPSETKKEKKHGEILFREGDRVMQIRNNYDILWKKQDGTETGTGIYNGDIGIIRTIDHQAETVTVVFDDREATLDFTLLSEIELAYAMTVHKSQGSEYRAVILTAWPGSRYLLTRSVLYTAVTRARNLLILVGSEEVIAAMVANDHQQRRYSGLKLRLQERDG